MPRPNILFICSDQQTYDAAGYAGNSWIRTPNLDALAASGTVFSRNYCTFPLCTPARASHFTGYMPHQVGASTNGATLDAPPHAMLGPVFRDAGYETIWAGKWHLPQWFPHRPDTVPGFHAVPRHRGKSDAEKDAHYTDEAIRFLEGPHRQPFFLSLQLHNPHEICDAFHNDIPPDADIPEDPALLPPVENVLPIPDEPEVIRRFRLQEISTYRHVDAWSDEDRRRCEELSRRALEEDDPAAEEALFTMRASRWDERALRRYCYHYYRLTEMMDMQVGRILAALEENGLRENTFVLFTSDHGEGAGAHRWLRKFMFYEDLVRTPLIASWPGVLPEGQTDTERIVSGLDLLPTFRGVAGIPADPNCPGQSVLPLLHDPHAPGRELAVGEINALEWIGQWAGRMLVTHEWKYIAFDQGGAPEMLFNLDADPGETRNLAYNGRFSAIRNRLRDLLKQWCDATDDDFQIPR